MSERTAADVLDGFEERLLADYERRNGIKVGSLPRPWKKDEEKKKWEIDLDRRREILKEAERKLIEDERRNLEQGREANRAWIEERRRMGEYHASMKRMHMEAEYWAKESRRDRGGYDPIKLFVDEIEKEIG